MSININELIDWQLNFLATFCNYPLATNQSARPAVAFSAAEYHGYLAIKIGC